MILRPRFVFALVALLSMAVVTGCGGGSSGKEASSSTDVNELLKDTFSGGKTIKSGQLDLALRIDSTGSSNASGPISVSLTGPFQSQGKGKLPKLDIEAKVDGAGQNISAGLVSTGEKGFVKFQGESYAVTDAIFAEFKKGFEQA